MKPRDLEKYKFYKVNLSLKEDLHDNPLMNKEWTHELSWTPLVLYLGLENDRHKFLIGDKIGYLKQLNLTDEQRNIRALKKYP